MPGSVKNILDRINGLQKELETALADKAAKFRYSYENRKLIFKADAIKWQRPFKINIWRYLSRAKILTVLTTPVIYALIVPFVLLDISVVIYQAICFPVYGIKKVKRSAYIVVDRQHLAYLNIVQKINCMYCGYGNGLLAFTSEVAARTEAFWCPIKHAHKLRAYHRHYGDFSDYGDAGHFQEDLERNMKLVEENPAPPPKSD